MVESLEMLGSCLEGIGDDRGIELLQEVYAETEANYIGESLETLCLMHDREIPELRRSAPREKRPRNVATAAGMN
jgi:hypothetical protein